MPMRITAPAISEGTIMATSVNVGGRLDRLPISAFHHRIFWLVGAGMLFDGFDLYVFTNVLPAAAQSGFSTPLQNADFISKTFLGMTIGALLTGFLGDRYGRRFTYQINLLVFGLASLAAAFAPDMTTLIWLRFVMGLGSARRLWWAMARSRNSCRPNLAAAG